MVINLLIFREEAKINLIMGNLFTLFIFLFLVNCGKNIPLFNKKEQKLIQEDSFTKEHDQLRYHYKKRLNALKEKKLKLEYKGFEKILKRKSQFKKTYLDTIKVLHQKYKNKSISGKEYRGQLKEEKFVYLKNLEKIKKLIEKRKKEINEK